MTVDNLINTLRKGNPKAKVFVSSGANVDLEQLVEDDLTWLSEDETVVEPPEATLLVI